MNATDLVIQAPGRQFSRTSPRARRTESTSAVDPQIFPIDLITRLADEMGQCACALAPESATIPVYNAEAFQYFLTLERKRAEVGGHRLHLALVDLKPLVPVGDEAD